MRLLKCHWSEVLDITTMKETLFHRLLWKSAAHVQNISSASDSLSKDGASSSTVSPAVGAGPVFVVLTRQKSYLDELRSQVDGAKPVPQVRVAVQGLGPLGLGHFLLALQLLTDVFHQLYLQGATEATRRSSVAGQESHRTT